MSYKLLPLPRFRYEDANGDPLASGKIYTYTAGTTTPLATYTDSTGGTPNTNPVILDSEGYADIWLNASSSYKIVIKDSNDVTISTTDNVTNADGANGAAGTFQMATAGGTVDAITATYSPVLTLTNLVTCGFVASGANTSTTPTFSPDGLTAHTITKRGGVPLVPGDIPKALAVCILEYNSANTRWELLNPATERTPWVIGAGTANAITATYDPAIVTVYDGLILGFRAAAANTTTTPTFSPNGLTARTITKKGGTALVAGDIAGNLAEYLVRYNSANTRWELLNPTGISGITDIGTVTIDPSADYLPFYDASGAVYGKTLASALQYVVTSATAQNTTSGTSIPFTGIPSSTKKIKVMLAGVSTNGTSNLLIQIGAGSTVTSGYISTSSTQSGSVANSTAGFIITASQGASDVVSGLVEICLQTGTTWVASSVLKTSTTGVRISAGDIATLGGTLDRVILTTVNGTDAFDAGVINIMYE